jgi:hypothetical protein
VVRVGRIRGALEDLPKDRGLRSRFMTHARVRLTVDDARAGAGCPLAHEPKAIVPRRGRARRGLAGAERTSEEKNQE